VGDVHNVPKEIHSTQTLIKKKMFLSPLPPQKALLTAANLSQNRTAQL
jgi:hypothetical protein